VSNDRQNLGNINTIILHSGQGSQAVPQQANRDSQVVSLWLHGRSSHTQKAYQKDFRKLCQHVDKPIRSITLGDLQGFADSLTELGYRETTQHRILAAVKSIFSFAQKIGYIQYNPAKALILPKFRDELTERILSESEVQRVIGMENNPRNKLLLRVLYASGIRVSELCRLKWKDLLKRTEGGQMTVFGKRGKTNVIIVPEPLWTDLCNFRGNSCDEDPVFMSRKKGHLSSVQVWRIIKKSAKNAGIKKNISTHWFRHAHASHALDRGAKISLVKETLCHSSIQTTGKYLHAKPGESSSTYLQV